MRIEEQVMGDEAGMEQAFHQMMQEREELAADCLKKLAEGVGGQKEIEYLAAFARIQNPYEMRTQ